MRVACGFRIVFDYSFFFAELLALVERYLHRCGFGRAALVLRKSIDGKGLVPERSDFRGDTHAQPYARYVSCS